MLYSLSQDYQTLFFILFVSLVFQIIILLKIFKKNKPASISTLATDCETLEPHPELQKSKSFEQEFYEQDNMMSKDAFNEDLKSIEKSKLFLNIKKENNNSD